MRVLVAVGFLVVIGVLAIAVLADYDPHDLVPTILISEFLTGFASFFFHAGARNVDLRRGSGQVHTALTLAVFSVVGVAIGVNIVLEISNAALTKLIGAHGDLARMIRGRACDGIDLTLCYGQTVANRSAPAESVPHVPLPPQPVSTPRTT
jgi:hypothetical protein